MYFIALFVRKLAGLSSEPDEAILKQPELKWLTSAQEELTVTNLVSFDTEVNLNVLWLFFAPGFSIGSTLELFLRKFNELVFHTEL